ncbi:endolytic transglycosylase MltG [Lentimicrobium sp. L6]|uniref:endolytic transglycosylase MltG n=2 Tax=unclassified Lentimicrobium TaxID=2677434 RepID=UPI001C12E408|nr:endolytic transglycosylase MltG [Lentimicrobium sp. L6]
MSNYHSSYRRNSRKKKNPFRMVLFILLIGIIIIGGIAAYMAYQIVMAPNIWTEEEKEQYIYINNEDDFESIKNQLYANGNIIHRNNFELLADYKKYADNIKPGRYSIKNGMNNNELINLLRSGNQEPIKLIFNNIRLKEDLSKRIAEQINIDEDLLLEKLNDSVYCNSVGFSTETVKSMFLPNTYFVYWNTTTDEFLNRMSFEYKQFWTEERVTKANDKNLNPIEVSILASIVEKETQKNDEKARVAGVYINRIESGWRLQADPTLIYALGDFNIKRVLNVYKEIDSPYNTYKYTGLPPGPICIPSISSINAVLNAEEHSYFFFCAKPDYSGYHNFAKNSKQHINNANAYREFLNKEKIFK